MTRPARPPAETAADASAWWAWVGVQALVVAVFAGGGRPTAGYPEPVEATADVALAAVQMMAAALLAPTLLATPAAWLRAMAAGLLFSVLAARLAGRPVSTTAGVVGVEWVWTAVFGYVDRDPVGRSAVLFLTFAVPVLMYARLEYGGRPYDLTGLAGRDKPHTGRYHHWPPRLGLASVCRARRHTFSDSNA